MNRKKKKRTTETRCNLFILSPDIYFLFIFIYCLLLALLEGVTCNSS